MTAVSGENVRVMRGGLAPWNMILECLRSARGDSSDNAELRSAGRTNASAPTWGVSLTLRFRGFLVADPRVDFELHLASRFIGVDDDVIAVQNFAV